MADDVVPVSSPSGGAAATAEFACYRCRRILFPSTALLTHTPGHVTAATFAGKRPSNVSNPLTLPTPVPPLPHPTLPSHPPSHPLHPSPHWLPCQSSIAASVCNSYFVDPDELAVGAFTDNEGKLSCPNCHSKLGSFTWSGSQCSCGEWVVPAFSFSRGKVDEKRKEENDNNRAMTVGGRAPIIFFKPRLEDLSPDVNSEAAAADLSNTQSEMHSAN